MNFYLGGSGGGGGGGVGSLSELIPCYFVSISVRELREITQESRKNFVKFLIRKIRATRSPRRTLSCVIILPSSKGNLVG